MSLSKESSVGQSLWKKLGRTAPAVNLLGGILTVMTACSSDQLALGLQAEGNKVDNALVSSLNTSEFVSNELLIKIKSSVRDRVKEDPFDTGIESLSHINSEYGVIGFKRVAKVGKNSNTDHDLFAWYIVTLDIASPLDSKSSATDGKPVAKGKLNQKTGNLETTDPSADILRSFIARLRQDPNIESLDLNYVVHNHLFGK